MTYLCDSKGFAFGSCLNKMRYKKGLGLAKIKDCNIICALRFFFFSFFFLFVVKSALVPGNLYSTVVMCTGLIFKCFLSFIN